MAAMNSVVAYVAWSAVAGALIPVMAASNGTLGRVIASPLHASVAAAILAALAVVLAFAALHPPAPASATLARAPLWSWFGGLAVGFYIVSATFVAPRFGVGNFVICVVVAQLVMSSLIDQFALFGAAQHPIELKRAIGLVVLGVGAVLVALK